jgi:hypothetical protein
MKIESITIVRESYGPDHCFIYTDLPEPGFPFKDKLMVRFDAARGSGVDYVRRYFDMEPKLIEA